MKKILVCGQKGGTGKSTISDEIAFSFERSGIPVAFLDLDVQGGTIHKTDRNPDAEVAVIDTPGALQAELPTWLAGPWWASAGSGRPRGTPCWSCATRFG